jgi:phospholipase/lecithinase/hemolysin
MRFIKSLKTLLFCLSIAILPTPGARASFTSLYAFGDGLSTTTAPSLSQADYFEGRRYCNGRIWIEVLCQWQGITYVEARNKSLYSNTSDKLVTYANSFVALPPQERATSLFVVWCVNADFIDYLPPLPYTSANIPAWTTFINGSIARHELAINTLYGKGMRTIILPNSANVAKAPFFGIDQDDVNFVRARAIQFNVALQALIANLKSAHPDLVIYQPDVFTLFESVLANPTTYGITKTNIDAIEDLGNPSFTGPGASYLFWDDQHPTAKFQMLLADLSQQLISPAKVTSATFSSTTGQIQVANIPLGRDGIVQTSTNLQPP